VDTKVGYTNAMRSPPSELFWKTPRGIPDTERKAVKPKLLMQFNPNLPWVVVRRRMKGRIQV
uniref:hypothetical protein n=1 Tax=uncultured Nitrospira sp. TaxID=157176 RepID=UPI003140512B